MAAVKACEQLRERIIALAAVRMNKDASALTFDGENVIDESDGAKMSLFDIATASMCNNEISLEVTYSHSSPVSPATIYGGVCGDRSRPGNRCYRVIGLHRLCGLWNGL